MASVVPKPARIPAVAKVARKIPPANIMKTNKNKSRLFFTVEKQKQMIRILFGSRNDILSVQF